MASQEIVTVTYAQAQWLKDFWVGAQAKRHPDAKISVSAAPGDESSSICFINVKGLNRKLLGVVRKLVSEDLGDMDAVELKQNIPQKGMGHLGELQHQLNIKVIWRQDGHVLLVGTHKKLKTKCTEIRSLLSHYHWRLSGKDVAFEEMVAKNGVRD